MTNVTSVHARSDGPRHLSGIANVNVPLFAQTVDCAPRGGPPGGFCSGRTTGRLDDWSTRQRDCWSPSASTRSGSRGPVTAGAIDEQSRGRPRRLGAAGAERPRICELRHPESRSTGEHLVKVGPPLRRPGRRRRRRRVDRAVRRRSAIVIRRWSRPPPSGIRASYGRSTSLRFTVTDLAPGALDTPVSVTGTGLWAWPIARRIRPGRSRVIVALPGRRRTAER